MYFVWEHDTLNRCIDRTRLFRSQSHAQEWIIRNQRSDYNYIVRLVTMDSILTKLKDQLHPKAIGSRVKSRFLKV